MTAAPASAEKASAATPPGAADAPGSPALTCWNCNASLAALPRPITRHMNCPACYEDLHCCRMCRHYRNNVDNACTDERAEPPTHKEGANFCDFFRPAISSYRSGTSERRTQAKSRLDALFGSDRDVAAGEPADEPPTDATEEAAAEERARQRLDALFR